MIVVISHLPRSPLTSPVYFLNPLGSSQRLTLNGVSFRSPVGGSHRPRTVGPGTALSWSSLNHTSTALCCGAGNVLPCMLLSSAVGHFTTISHFTLQRRGCTLLQHGNVIRIIYVKLKKKIYVTSNVTKY